MTGDQSDYKFDFRADYAKYLLASYGMPTLLGLKPSSMISVNKNNLDMSGFLKVVEAEIKQYGCSYDIIYENRNMFHLFIYQEELMERLLIDQSNMRFLKSFGYDYTTGVTDQTLVIIKRRLEQYHRTNSDFPHEIGVVLGYPVKDVEAFIRYKGKQYIFCGYWKVYQNAKEASDIFESYNLVRQKAIRLLIEGKS